MIEKRHRDLVEFELPSLRITFEPLTRLRPLLGRESLRLLHRVGLSANARHNIHTVCCLIDYDKGRSVGYSVGR